MCGSYELDYSPKSKLSLQGMTMTADITHRFISLMIRYGTIFTCTGMSLICT